jgi:hypothetical protein
VPVGVEVPAAGRGIAAVVAPWFEGGGEAFGADGEETGLAEAAPFVAAFEALVSAERDEVVDVVALGVEAGEEAYEDRVGGREPLRGAAASVFAERGGDAEAVAAEGWVAWVGEGEDVRGGGDGFVPAGGVGGFETVGEEDAGVGGDGDVGFEGCGETVA